MSSASVASSSQRAASSSLRRGAKARIAVARVSGREEGSASGSDLARPPAAPSPEARGAPSVCTTSTLSSPSPSLRAR